MTLKKDFIQYIDKYLNELQRKIWITWTKKKKSFPYLTLGEVTQIWRMLLCFMDIG